MTRAVFEEFDDGRPPVPVDLTDKKKVRRLVGYADRLLAYGLTSVEVEEDIMRVYPGLADVRIVPEGLFLTVIRP